VRTPHIIVNAALGLLTGALGTFIYVRAFRFLNRGHFGNKVPRQILDLVVWFTLGLLLLAATLIADAVETMGRTSEDQFAFIIAALAPALAARIIAEVRARRSSR